LFTLSICELLLNRHIGVQNWLSWFDYMTLNAVENENVELANVNKVYVKVW
jgi:hypothetical protein